jgi:hypothetical protein
MNQASERPPGRAALLLIHGIGEQAPYQTLDAFARGLADRLQLKKHAMAHRLVWKDGRAQTRLRMNLAGDTDPLDFESLDLLEFYWAGMVQQRIKIRGILAWIARVSLTPLRHWAQQPAVLFREKADIKTPLWVFLREIFRAALLLTVAVALLLPFIYAAYNAEAVAAAGQELWAIVSGVQRPLAAVVWLLLVFLALMILRGWLTIVLHWARYRREAREGFMEGEATKWWARASLVAIAALILLALWVYVHYQLDLVGTLAALWTVIRPWPVLAPLLAVVAAFVLRVPLIKYVGDIALYVTADERSALFRTRDEILVRATATLRDLLLDDEYGWVFVAGHSLGSVIAYDTINRIVREVRSQGEAEGQLSQRELDKLRGLLTFGSPLDKVYYFFRTRVRDEETIRAQLLSSIHAFRKRRSGRSYGDDELAEYTVSEPERFAWLNVYSFMDRISGELDFYKVDEQVHRPYWNPVTAHLAYWNDSEFYSRVTDWLAGQATKPGL